MTSRGFFTLPETNSEIATEKRGFIPQKGTCEISTWIMIGFSNLKMEYMFPSEKQENQEFQKTLNGGILNLIFGYVLGLGFFRYISIIRTANM